VSPHTWQGHPGRDLQKIPRGYSAAESTVPNQMLFRQSVAPRLDGETTVTLRPASRMFCRLKYYRRIAARYNKLATRFLGAIYLATVVTWWS
jgi:transposase